MSPARVAAVMGKEAREILRDPITIWISLMLPLVMLFLFGYAINLDVDDISLGVLDRDRSPASRALVHRFAESGYFRFAASLESDRGVEAELQRGRIKAALVIPSRFHERLVSANRPRVQLLVDGTHSFTALLISHYADTIIGAFRPTAREPARAPPVRVEARVLYNPPMRSVNFVVPGLYGVILMAFPPLLTTLAIVREKERGSVQQIFASPLTSAEFVAGKLVPYALIAFMQMLIVVAAGFYWFAVPFRGNVGFLLGTSIVYVLSTVSIGLLVSTVTRSQLVAMLLALLFTLMPSFLFSGFLFPLFTMPYVLQLYTFVFPGRYFVELTRGIVLKGGGLETLWPNVALLIAYTAVVFALAALRFRKKVA